MMINRVNWGSIFAGALIGIASMVFFSLFALAVGINGVNVVQPLTTSISFGAAAYTVVTSVISFALGGYCTTRLAGLRDPGSACLHALTSFALAGALVPFLFTRTFLVGTPGFAIAPPAGFFVTVGLAWTLFLSYALAAVAACAGGVQACYRGVGVMGEGAVYDETYTDRRRPAA